MHQLQGVKSRKSFILKSGRTRKVFNQYYDYLQNDGKRYLIIKK